ncbi:uncharacterized protein LOC110020499 [Phalaenopsis equestris]|uniref:uncharacterized protein LOC110020499 n=1 Tax=Phalaenopsis equestris TaxID=78828 RepID=UPI0009E21042|nr:uncharacterized protein LOC110020499 [Phalaenopsis equestris]
MNKKATPVAGLQGKICHKHRAPFESKLGNDAIASKSALCFPIISQDICNNHMTRKSRGNSRRCELPRYPCRRSSILANPKDYTNYKDNNGKPVASSIARHFGLGHALKCSSLDRDIGCFGNARRVCHKPLLWDLNLITHANISSSHFVGQEHRRSTDLKTRESEYFKILFATGILAPPPRSVELAKKILRTLDGTIIQPVEQKDEAMLKLLPTLLQEVQLKLAWTITC